MKRATAIHHVMTIAARLHAITGLLGTPATSHEAVRIRRAWVFGSTVKGSENPNDVDILLDFTRVGRRYWANTPRNASFQDRRRYIGAKRDKDHWRSHGLILPVSAENEVFRYLRVGMKMVRLHPFEVDGNYGDIPQTRVLIYPRNDFATQLAQGGK